MIAALLLIAVDIWIRNPHYDYCMTLDPNSWQFILSGCDIYGGTLAAGVTCMVLMGLLAGAVRLMRPSGV